MKHTKLLLVAFFVMLFSATLSAQTIYGYAIFGDVPYRYEDLRDQVQVSTDITMNGENIQSGTYTDPSTPLTFTGTGLSGGNACQYYAALSIRFRSNQILTLTGGMVIHIKIKRSDENSSGLMRISMHKNTWANGGRLTFQIANTDLTSSVSELLCAYASPLNWSWSTNGQDNLIGTQTYYGGAGKELFRFEAANGEKFEITQIYIKADSNPDPEDPNECTDEDAPTGLTLAASNIQDKSVTLTASANDAASSISYEFFYKAEGDAEFTSAGTASAAPNTDATKEVTGLAPETNYTFKVVATDPCNNEAEFVKPEEVQTLAFVERRYYFFRGDPASVTLPSTGVISYDLRRGVKTNVAPQNGMTLTENKYFSHFAKSGGWWSFNQSLSASFDMSEISQADWYLVVKFRTDYTSNSFNIRLNNGISYQVSQNNLSISTDGTWNVLTLALADAKNALTYSAFSTNQMLFQFHADDGAGSYLDIAYAYLTNNAASVEDFADNTNPVISAVSDGDKTTSEVVLNITASDDSAEPLTYIIKEGDDVLTSTPATGASGEATAVTVSGLDGQNHTLTVIAQDWVGNQASQNIAITLPAAVTPPTNLSVSAVPADFSVSFTMSADDANAALVYAILDANQEVLVDNIAGTAGENTVYVLKGLTPETAYSFYVRVTNNASLSITSEEIQVTTNEFIEHRYYLLRGDNTEPLPSSVNLTSTMVESTVEYKNSSRDARISDYVSAKTGNTWMAIDLKPMATVDNDIDDDWYIVVRFRSNLSTSFGFDRFRLNLSNNAANWYINNSDSDKPFGHDYNDGQWVVIKKRIGDRRAGTAVPASYLVADQIAAQLHVNGELVAGEYLDIDYIYFTNGIVNIDEGTQTHRRIALKDTESNDAVLTARDGETVDVDLTRSLSSSYYNTLCLPFDLSADQVADIFGVASIGKLGNARIKDNDELYLGFEFVNHMEAGVPYLIQPESDVNNPSFIAGVEISNDPGSTVIDGVVSFIGIFSPTEIVKQSAADHDILILGPNNILSWPNATQNMNGMRAYFQTTQTVAYVARRASFMVQQSEIYTDMEVVEPEADQDGKVLRNGQIYIIRNGVVYDIMGKRVQ